jgi:transposase
MSKHCKKCGKEIPRNSRNDHCENCQNKTNGVIRQVGVGALTLLSLGLWVITKGKFGGPKV